MAEENPFNFADDIVDEVQETKSHERRSHALQIDVSHAKLKVVSPKWYEHTDTKPDTPQFAEELVARCELAYSQGHFEAAASLAKQFMAPELCLKMPSAIVTQARDVAARTMEAAGWLDQALTVIETHPRHPRPDPSFIRLKASVLRKLGRHADAIAVLKDSLSMAPSARNPFTWRDMALSLFESTHTAEQLAGCFCLCKVHILICEAVRHVPVTERSYSQCVRETEEMLFSRLRPLSAMLAASSSSTSSSSTSSSASAPLSSPTHPLSSSTSVPVSSSLSSSTPASSSSSSSLSHAPISSAPFHSSSQPGDIPVYNRGRRLYFESLMVAVLSALRRCDADNKHTELFSRYAIVTGGGSAGVEEEKEEKDESNPFRL